MCLNCSLAYTHPLIQGDESDVGNSESTITSADYYVNILRDYDVQVSIAKSKASNMLKYWSQVIGRTPLSVLEIGCGTGQYYEAWKELGIEWTGFEVNQEMLKFCRARSIPVDDCNIMKDIKKDNKKYDVIFMSQVLEHILTPQLLLDRIKDYLADGGILHIDVPNHDSLTSLYRRVNFLHHEYGFIQPDFHLIAYNKKALAHLLVHKGFQLCHIDVYANDHHTFGQLLASKSILSRLSYAVSRIIKRGSLLVCIAKRVA